MLVLDVKMLEESSDFYLSDSSSTASSITTVLTNNSIDDQPDGNAQLGLIGISPATPVLSPQSLTTMTTTLHPLGICHQRQHPHPQQQQQQQQHHHHPHLQQHQPPPPPLPSQSSPVHLQCLSSIGSSTNNGMNGTVVVSQQNGGSTIPQPPELQLHSPQSVASSSSLSSVGSYNSGITSSLLSDTTSVAHDPSTLIRVVNGGDSINCIDTMAADSSTGHLKGEVECNNNNTNTSNSNSININTTTTTAAATTTSTTTNNNGSSNPSKEGGGGGGEAPVKKKNPVGRRKLILSAREKTLRRLESNERERLRMHSLNQAFQVDWL